MSDTTGLLSPTAMLFSPTSPLRRKQTVLVVRKQDVEVADEQFPVTDPGIAFSDFNTSVPDLDLVPKIVGFCCPQTECRSRRRQYAGF
jgi:hypothetical protein